ncbi:hypothetical protein CcaverHIS002_0410880 [Cutaneotrichosporon cavernicola]|uniref:Uncharacterized protein n=1 Tax=Cutaneotrichosporon cavernicola TaxID=279322 RepID=A0AA48L5E1_9TREE|nr:uncharacterized protein CcaverHIS019_0410780 [Cutaneotrichosporon cavernicola]BEI84484.1 hypothetical protein CcaverHIS002_0410880 [Cutaneotrichosporon cavernicola]BEI92258.1 hypothetical protein CcaverHIS019_0410780 [Cutaneotrichosporon cavernicola]BEJ00030.1 hypothetical protein CcaverHIS631_0410720 [Cutaneotrichosporon cavernicola]BEJ07802.1 hypothetical protein CcaverHIS641_0410710 [Cutaneotrichosporon cavernicola]
MFKWLTKYFCIPAWTAQAERDTRDVQYGLGTNALHLDLWPDPDFSPMWEHHPSPKPAPPRPKPKPQPKSTAISCPNPRHTVRFPSQSDSGSPPKSQTKTKTTASASASAVEPKSATSALKPKSATSALKSNVKPTVRFPSSHFKPQQSTKPNPSAIYRPKNRAIKCEFQTKLDSQPRPRLPTLPAPTEVEIEAVLALEAYQKDLETKRKDSKDTLKRIATRYERQKRRRKRETKLLKYRLEIDAKLLKRQRESLQDFRQAFAVKWPKDTSHAAVDDRRKRGAKKRADKANARSVGQSSIKGPETDVSGSSGAADSGVSSSTVPWSRRYNGLKRDQKVDNSKVDVEAKESPDEPPNVYVAAREKPDEPPLLLEEASVFRGHGL